MESIINAQVPEFKVNAFQNGEFKTVSNEDIKGKWALFFFYPADFTFVCPTELVDLAEKYDQLKADGVEVFSVSCDTHFVHKAWHDASPRIKNIEYTMLADPLAVLAKAFGVYKEDEGIAYRGTFVELVRKIEAAQFVATHQGEVCPARWTRGKETLKPGVDLVGKL